MVAHGIFVWKQSFFEAGDEDAVKLQALGRVHGHQLHCILPGLRLVVSRLQSGVGKKSHQRTQGFAGFKIRRQKFG